MAVLAVDTGSGQVGPVESEASGWVEGDLREKSASSCRVHTSQNMGHTSGYSALWVQAWPCLCFTHQSPWGGGQHLAPGMWGLYQEPGGGCDL